MRTHTGRLTPPPAQLPSSPVPGKAVSAQAAGRGPHMAWGAMLRVLPPAPQFASDSGLWAHWALGRARSRPAAFQGSSAVGGLRLPPGSESPTVRARLLGVWAGRPRRKIKSGQRRAGAPPAKYTRWQPAGTCSDKPGRDAHRKALGAGPQRAPAGHHPRSSGTHPGWGGEMEGEGTAGWHLPSSAGVSEGCTLQGALRRTLQGATLGPRRSPQWHSGPGRRGSTGRRRAAALPHPGPATPRSSRGGSRENPAGTWQAALAGEGRDGKGPVGDRAAAGRPGGGCRPAIPPGTGGRSGSLLGGPQPCPGPGQSQNT